MNDPGETSLDDSEPGRGASAYVTKKDVKVFFIGLVGLFLVLTPFYLYFREETRASKCLRNLKAIHQALAAYAEENSNLLPPAYAKDEHGQILMEHGKPFTWASLTRQYMTARWNFLCDSADPTEPSIVSHPQSSAAQIECTYGLYAPLELMPMNDIPDGASTILLAETSRNGSRGTFDPHPFANGMDSFLIGFDSGDEVNAKTAKVAKFVTRLALFDLVKDGALNGQAVTRHRSVIHAVTAAGSAIKLTPADAEIKRDLNGNIGRPWTIPAAVLSR